MLKNTLKFFVIVFVLTFSVNSVKADYLIQTNSDTTVTGGYGYDNTYHKRAVLFTTIGEGTIEDISVWLGGAGTMVDNTVVEIRTESSGSPSGTVLGTATISNSGLTSCVQKNAILDMPVALSAATNYWVVYYRSGANHTTVRPWTCGSSVGSDKHGSTGNVWTTDNDEEPRFEATVTEPEEPILGCMDEEANNYDPLATEDDFSCEYDEVVLPPPMLLSFASSTCSQIGTSTPVVYHCTSTTTPIYTIIASSSESFLLANFVRYRDWLLGLQWILFILSFILFRYIFSTLSKSRNH